MPESLVSPHMNQGSTPGLKRIFGVNVGKSQNLHLNFKSKYREQKKITECHHLTYDFENWIDFLLILSRISHSS